MSGRTLIPDFQPSALGDNRRPHVLTRQTAAHWPPFVEHRNRAIGGALSHEMETAGRNGQQAQQVGDLGGGQAPAALAALRLAGRQGGQHGPRIFRHIPVDEGWTGPTHMPEHRPILRYNSSRCSEP
jgi:hypothetical protein